MAESTVATAVTQAPVARRQFMPLWKLLLLAVGFHIVMTIVGSPGRLFTRNDTTPEGLLAQARDLVQQQKYQEAMDVYGRLLLQKPATPAVFVDAEKEVREVRLKALEAQKKAAEEGKGAKGDENKPGGPGKKPGEGTGGKDGTTKPPEGGTPPKPPVELPTLPDIGGDGP